MLFQRSLSRDSRSEHTRPSSMNREPDNDAKAIIEKEQMQTGKVKIAYYTKHLVNIDHLGQEISVYELLSCLQHKHDHAIYWIVCFG